MLQSSVQSQFYFCTIFETSALAQNLQVLLHIWLPKAHSLIKLALFMAAGVMKTIEWIFLISGGLTVAYMTKLYVCIFVEKNADKDVQAKYNSLQGKYMNKVSAFALGLSATLLPIMGFFPSVVMDGLADMGQSFMQVSETGEKISYFSLTNLKGAAISIIIGTLIYVVYRPLLLQILPFIFGVICRVLDSLVDTFVVVLRKTIYKDSKLPQELSEGTAFSHACACIAEWWQTLGNLTFRKKKPRTVDYDHKFAILHEEWAENNTVIVRSMSFGLLMFCIGLIITVAYLFLRDVFGVW